MTCAPQFTVYSEKTGGGVCQVLNMCLLDQLVQCQSGLFCLTDFHKYEGKDGTDQHLRV